MQNNIAYFPTRKITLCTRKWKIWLGMLLLKVDLFLQHSWSFPFLESMDEEDILCVFLGDVILYVGNYSLCKSIHST